MKTLQIFLLTACAAATAAMTGCAAVPYALNAAGVGQSDDTKVVAATAKQFGVEPISVVLSGVKREQTLAGTKIFYDASIGRKSFRCYMGTSVTGDTLPICAKPGEPLNVPF